MSELRSSVLIINHPDPGRIDFGVDFTHSFREAREKLLKYSYPVIVLPLDINDRNHLIDFFQFLAERCPSSKIIGVKNHAAKQMTFKIASAFTLFRLLRNWQDPQLQLFMQEALERFHQENQETDLFKLFQEQNEQLEKLTIELEDRVQKRQASLADSRARLLSTNKKFETLHSALVAIQESTSIGEMEQNLSRALKESLHLSWIRIQFQSHDNFERFLSRDQSLAIVRQDLLKDRDTVGAAYFARPKETPFTRDETAFIRQIGETISLATDRLIKLKESEMLKQQWEATFDAIQAPMCLINPDYELIRTNRAFAKASGSSAQHVFGRKCYESLFGRTSPCPGCQLGAPFRLPPCKTESGKDVIYAVHSQTLDFHPYQQSVYLNIYHDVSEKLRLEHQILESAKLAELGTIGSSIAHELNNPLGGMINFLQLIKMDLKGNETYWPDIDEMEKGAKRCKDIVRNLLGFTRRPDLTELKMVSLNEVIEQAIKITELQTRSMGVSIEFTAPDDSIDMMGRFNLLAQAITSYLHRSQLSILHKKKKDKNYLGQIRIFLKKLDDRITVEIQDDGDQNFESPATAQAPAALEQVVARQIVQEHGGTIDESPSIKGWNRLLLRFTAV